MVPELHPWLSGPWPSLPWKHRPDLLAADQLHHRCAAVTDQAGDLVQRNAVVREQADEAVAQLSKRPLVRSSKPRPGWLVGTAPRAAGPDPALPLRFWRGRAGVSMPASMNDGNAKSRDAKRWARGVVPRGLPGGNPHGLAVVRALDHRVPLRQRRDHLCELVRQLDDRGLVKRRAIINANGSKSSRCAAGI
jgi:hypothetical protein